MKTPLQFRMPLASGAPTPSVPGGGGVDPGAALDAVSRRPACRLEAKVMVDLAKRVAAQGSHRAAEYGF